jgi:hypothetical protein
VAVNEPGHNPLPGGIDDLHLCLILQLHVGRQRPGTADAVAVDDQGGVRNGWTAGPIDQSAVLNN